MTTTEYTMKLRINKLISDAGLGSRREVEEYILQGRVKINGKRATLGDMVSEKDIVLLDGVDLPIKDLIRERIALEKIEAQERAKAESKQSKKDRADERAESQRQQHASKSAALRKTSKNNPINKRRAQPQAEQDEWEEAPKTRRAGQHLRGSSKQKLTPKSNSTRHPRPNQQD